MRHAGLLAILLATTFAGGGARAAEAGRVEVKAFAPEFTPEAYRDKGELGFLVDVHDDSGPVENLDKATWSLLHLDKPVEATPSVVGFKGAGLASSLLVMIPATANFIGQEEADATKERSIPPLSAVLEGLQTLKNSFGGKSRKSGY